MQAVNWQVESHWVTVCDSLRSEECLVVTLVCLIGMSRSGVSHIQFEFPAVSSRGVTSGLPSWWYCHSAGHRVVLKPGLLGLCTRLDPPVWHCL